MINRLIRQRTHQLKQLQLVPLLRAERPYARALMRFTSILRHQWPAAKNPTCYEIFKLDPNEKLQAKRIRQIYFELVKIYHPDRGGDASKFKRIVEAHKQLNSLLNRKPTNPNTYTPRTYTSDPFEGFDFNPNTQAEFDESLKENRLFILKLVVSVTAVISVLNFILVKQTSEFRSEKIDKETMKVASSLLADELLDPDLNTAQSRIERFLRHRQRTLNNYEDFSYDTISKGVTRSTKTPPPPTKHNTGEVAEYFGRD